MQHSKESNLKTGGIVVTFVIVILFGVYFIGKNQKLFNDTFRLCAVFPDMGGLQIGDKVRFDGINIGEIEGVNLLSDTSVMVYFLIDEDKHKFIKKRSTAMITSEGLMGSKTLSILPADFANPPVNPDDTLVSVKPISVDDILVNIQSTANNAKLIAENFSAITGKMDKGKGMVGKLMHDKKFSKNLDTAVFNFKHVKEDLGGDEKEEPEKKDKKLFRLFRKKHGKLE